MSRPVIPHGSLQEAGDVAYFLFDDPKELHRFDLAGGSWLTKIVLPDTPTAFAVDADGLYVSFGRRTSRVALDGTGEVHLRNSSTDVTELLTRGAYIYIVTGNTVTSASKTMAPSSTTRASSTACAGSRLLRRCRSCSVAASASRPLDILEVILGADGTIGSQDDSPYHGDYPGATQTFVFPDEVRVADTAGIVYSTSDLLYAGEPRGSLRRHGLRR